MKNKLNLLSFLLPLYEANLEGGGGTGVGIVAPDPAVVMAADSPSAQESSSTNAGDVIAEEGQRAVGTQEADPLKDVPTLEELQEQANQKVPYAQALANLRTAYEGVKPQLEEFKTFEPWKNVVKTINDPVQAQTAYEMIQALRTPIEGQSDEYTSRPFIDRAEQERPGTANNLFHDLLTYRVLDENGTEDTLVRHQFRSYGLDPDRLNDYRNIDTLRASGVVTAEDLSAIPDKFHDAFRALSQAQQEDIIAQKQTDATGKTSYPPATLDYLQDKAEALEARQWRQRDEQSKQDAQQRQQVEFQQKVAADVEQDIGTEVQSIHDSILNKSLSQFTFSSDATQDSLEKGKILGVLANLQHIHPVYRNMAAEQLKAVGVDVNATDESGKNWDTWIADWEHQRSKYVGLKAAGQENTWDAREALSKSNFAKQMILAKANDYALKLAKAGGERAASAAAQTGSQLETATARFVPSGAAQTQQGNANPYMNNPHPIGSQEYYAFNRGIDKQYNLNGASMFS